MRETARAGEELRGKEVAFTGRLASMTREEAEDLVRARGGVPVPEPGARTDYLVVGREGWPLAGDGRVSLKLERARKLQGEGCPIAVLKEEEFLREVGLVEEETQIRRLYTAAQLARILGTPAPELRRWMRSGLIKPSRTVHRLDYFDFIQVASARSLWKLAGAGVPLGRIRRSLEELRAWMPDVENPLAQLSLMERERRILVRLGDDQVADTTGQLYFPFPEFSPGSPAAPAPVPMPRPAAGRAEWFEAGLRAEEAGRLEDAACAYGEAASGERPEPEACFNLGNVLYALGRKDEAAAPFLRAVELDPRYIEAWNNLGNVLAELGELEEAIRAYRKALEIEPLYADAHLNLAEALRHTKRLDEARHHWRVYLRHDPRSAWAEHVRRRLSEGRSSQ